LSQERALAKAATPFKNNEKYDGQNKGQSFELPAVRGTVLSSQAMPARSAIVYLYDDRTQSVKTFIAGKNDRYRFSGPPLIATRFTPNAAA
jgi:hypothetical protein